jgi:hypothetical protein
LCCSWRCDFKQSYVISLVIHTYIMASYITLSVQSCRCSDTGRTGSLVSRIYKGWELCGCTVEQLDTIVLKWSVHLDACFEEDHLELYKIIHIL